LCVFFFKQKTAYEITYGDWSSDVCSSDLNERYTSEIETLKQANEKYSGEIETLRSEIESIKKHLVNVGALGSAK